MNIDALIFDVDGTLADTEEGHRQAFNLAFEAYGLGWRWDADLYRRLLDVTGGKERIAAHIHTLALPDAERRRLLDQVPALHAQKTRYYSAFVADGHVPLREGVERLLHEAQQAGCRLAIATTTSAENISALLQATLGSHAHGLFSVIACGDEVVAKKPAPDVYQLALARLGLPATRALALEDSAHGLAAAVAAGLWTLVTPTRWTAGSDFSAAGWVLSSLGRHGTGPGLAELRQRAQRAYEQRALLTTEGSPP